MDYQHEIDTKFKGQRYRVFANAEVVHESERRTHDYPGSESSHVEFEETEILVLGLKGEETRLWLRKNHDDYDNILEAVEETIIQGSAI